MSTVAIPEQEINPVAFQIGSLIGLLSRQTDETYALNSQWFNDPWSYISAVPRNPELFGLLETLMGSATGNSLGAARQLIGRQWYPIMNPFSDGGAEPKPTGVYIVASKPEPGKRTDFGFGLLYEWKYDAFSLLPYAYFPLIALPKDANDSFEFILGTDDHPVETGIEVTGTKGIFNTGEGLGALSFDGFQAGSQIWFGGQLPSLDLVFLNLKLPGERQGANRSIMDLIANINVPECVTMALAIMGSRLSAYEGPAGTTGKMISSLLELLGLIGPVPGIDWNALIKDPAQVVQILTTWLQDIAGNPNTLKSWLNDWYCLFKGLDSAVESDHITGNGTRELPFSANLLRAEFSPGLSIDFNLTIAAIKNKEGVLQLFPGFQILSSPVKPISSIPSLGIQMAARAEVLCYSIAKDRKPSSSDITFFPSYSILASAANTTAGQPLFAVTDIFGNHAQSDTSTDQFSIGSMQIGFTYDELTSGKAGKVPSPNFSLLDVQTAIGSWPVISLANFNMKTIEETIGPVVSQAILSFFGEDNQYAKAFTAVLGIAAPSGYTGTWPLQDQLLLSAGELELLIKNPFVALGAYYSRCLATSDNDHASLFHYLVPEFATLLGGSSTSVSGTGIPDDPWLIPLLTVGSSTLNLSMYRKEADELTMAFNCTIPLPVTAVSLIFNLNAELLVMGLPAGDGSGAYSASWMQSLTGALKIASKTTGNKLQTPAIGGVSLSANNVLIQGGWTHSDNFFMTAGIMDVQLNASSGNIELGNILFSTAGWSVDQLKQFTPAIINSLGLLMMENGGKPGVAMAAILGTLPNLPEIFDGQTHDNYQFPIPEGLVLPKDWPTLSITDFANPWNDIRKQFSALYAGGSAMIEPAMRMIGWIINGSTPPVPVKIPEGTLIDPWYVHLPEVFGIDLLTWVDEGQTGFGIRRQYALNAFGNVQLATALRADFPGFSLTGNGGNGATILQTGFAIVNYLQNSDPTQPLLALGDIVIGKVQLGGSVMINNGQFNFAPVFRFIDSQTSTVQTERAPYYRTVRQPARAGNTPVADTLALYELIPVPGKPQWDCPQGMEVFDSLVHSLMGKLSEVLQSGSFPQLKSLVDLLVLLGLGDHDIIKNTYSFNPGGWASLLSNPWGYLSVQSTTLLSNSSTCAALVSLLADLLGDPATKTGNSKGRKETFDLPAGWQGIQYLLESLNLVKDHNGFYIPVMDNWLTLFGDPVGYIQSSVSTLFGNKDLLKQLITSLAKILPSDNRFFNVDPSGTILTLQIPPGTARLLGQDIQLFATSVLDAKSLTLTNHLAIGSTVLDSALGFSYNPTYKDGKLSADYGFYLEGLPGVTPTAFPPLPIWPFPADKEAYLKQIGFQIPMTLLSSFGTKYLNDFVAPVNPAVLNIFEVLGLTIAIDGEKPRIKPLAGIFMHPVEWLFSPQVLGNEAGGIDLSKLGALLYAVAAQGGVVNGNITLQPFEHDGLKDGVALTGLPWGLSFNLYANTAEGIHLQGNFVPSLSSPAPIINLTGAVSFANGNGVGIEGSIGMAYNFGMGSDSSPVLLGITAAYAKKSFTLTATADQTKFDLLPFGGLNQFLNAGTAGLLLKIIGDKLFGAYDDYILKNPGSALKPFIESIKTLSGITSGETLYQFFNAIYDDPLGQFNATNIKTLLPRINDFVSNILQLQGFTIVEDGNLLQYEHTFSSMPNATVIVQVGLRNINSSTVFGLWLSPAASWKWMSLGLNKTGVGVVMPVNYDQPELRFDAAITIAADLTDIGIAGAPQPAIVFGLSADGAGFHGPALNFYPTGISTENGTLSIEILPQPQLLIQGQQSVTLLQWMVSFGVEFLIPLAADTALAQDSVKKWLDDTTIGTVKGAPGQILTNWGLLSKTAGQYSLNDIRKVFNPSDPIGIVTSLIFTALDLLDGQRVVPIKDHGIYVKSESGGTGKRYGLRIQIPDITVYEPATDGAKLVLQLGKYYNGQDAGNNWTGLNTEPGIIAYFINRKTDQTISFAPKFELVSIGLDFEGANAQKQLINAKGVGIQAIRPRAYVSLDTDGLKTDFGAGIMLDKLALPLGPGFDKQGSSSNPVAQNLVTSGGNPGHTDAINPDFSISASYVTSTQEFTLQLYDANDIPTDKVWISIMRAFGPLQCRKVGIGWEGNANPKRLNFLFDGNVSLAGLMVDLIELEIGIPITDPTNFGAYSLDLAGLDISFNAGAVSITGGFLKDNSRGFIQYIGQAMIQAGSYGIGAFGAYALIDNHPSLFIFAYLNAPMGGPPFFYLKGLSGGFGYNRTINIPPANQIESFPFVAGIQNSSQLGGKDGKAPTNEDALRALGNDIVPPELGSYWLAAGVMFASFELVEANAVLMVIFGNDFEIALLGLAGLKLPKTGHTYVGAQIAFKVSYKVSTGLLAIEAVLTSNSYVIDPNCRLTGGLAFYVWFKNQVDTQAKAGEFVFTLGGYNPRFKKPSYFPDMPRLGFSWSVSNTVSIKGGAYFALTPSAVMAGGSLEAVFQSGALKAWFTAYADFLIMWNPFHYDIGIGVSVGASYTVKFIWTTTFKVELGADLHIWGPEMAGKVRVHWWVISFTVGFGATDSDSSGTTIIEWTEFKPYFLPADQPPPAPPQQLPEIPPTPEKQTGAVTRQTNPPIRIIPAISNKEVLPKKVSNSNADGAVQQVMHIRQVSGLIKELDDNGQTVWQINPGGFIYTVNTVVPLNKINFSNTTTSKDLQSDVAFGIRPMGSVVFGTPGQLSTMQVTMTYQTNPYDPSAWTFTSELNGMPESLWGTVNDGKTPIDAKIIPDALIGFTGRLTATSDNLPAGGPPMFPLSNLGYAAWPLRKLTLANNPSLHPATAAVDSDQSLVIIENSIMNSSEVLKRTAILESVLSAGINVGTDGRLDQMAAFATATFQSFPLLGQLGSIALGITVSGTQGTKSLLGSAASGLHAARITGNVMLSSTFLQRREMAAASHAGNPIKIKKDLTPPAPPRLKAVTLQFVRQTLLSPVFMGASFNDIKATHPVKGMMYSPGMAPDWQVEAVRQFGSSDGQVYTIYPGVSMLIDLDASEQASRIIPDGNVPVFGAWFDIHNQVLGSRILNGLQTIPGSCSQLILVGLSDAAIHLPFAYGWHVTSQLTLVNPNALTGVGAIILPDSPVRLRSRRRSDSYGLIMGSEMVRQNQISRTVYNNDISETKKCFAATETILPGGLQTIAVLVIGQPTGVDVKLAINSANGPVYQALEPAATITGQMETALLFEVPENTGFEYCRIYTIPVDRDLKVTGIMGLAEPVSEVVAAWKEVVLQPPLPATINDDKTTITIERS